MAIAYSTDTDKALQYQAYLIQKLLYNYKTKVVLAQYGLNQPIALNIGSKIATFFRKSNPAGTNVTALAEGTVLNTFNNWTLSKIDATLSQYANSYRWTDVLDDTALFKMMDGLAEHMGHEIAIHQDNLIRNVIVADGSVTTYYAQGAASFNALGSAVLGSSTLLPSDIVKEVAVLASRNVLPAADGRFKLAADPRVMVATKNDTGFQDVSSRGNYKQVIGNGLIGSYFNVDILEHTNAYTERFSAPGEGTSVPVDGSSTTTNTIFTSFLFGSEPWATVELSGQGPMSPEMMYVDGASYSDPAAQFRTYTAKMYYTAASVGPLNVIKIKSKAAVI